MKTKAYIFLGFAMAMWGYSPLMFGPNKAAIIIVGIILTLTALVLFFNTFLSARFKWIVPVIAFIESLNMEYTVIGLGFLMAAIGFLIPRVLWLGIIFAIVAAVFLLANKIAQIKNILDELLT